MFALIGIATFFGIIAGYLLALIAPEELQPGKSYLQFFQNALLLASVILFLALNELHFLMTVVVSAVLIVVLYLFTQKKKEQDLHKVIYVMTPLLIYFSDGVLLHAIAALIFLYGMPTASLFAGSRTRLSRIRLLGATMEHYGIFLLLVLILAILA
jgi:hypothetical protein